MKFSSDLLSFMQASNDPWTIKDHRSCYRYATKQFYDLLALADEYMLEGKYDFDLPHECAKYHQYYFEQDKLVYTNKRSYSSLEVFPFGKTKKIDFYLSERMPMFDDNNCIGVITYYSQTKLFSMFSFLSGGFYTFEKPFDLFSDNEWNVIFLLCGGVRINDIATIIYTSVRNVFYHIENCLIKTNTLNRYELVSLCKNNGWHYYIPYFFIKKHSNLVIQL